MSIIVVLCLLLAAEAVAATSQVSSSDALSAAVSRLTPGDTLQLASGTYTQGLTNIPAGESWERPVRIQAAPGTRPVIRTSYQSPVRFARTSYVILDGFVIRGDKGGDDAGRDDGDGPTGGGAAVRIDTGAHHIRLMNSEISHAGSQGIVVRPGCDGNEFLNLDVHDNGTNDFEHGIYLQSSGNLIEGSRIAHNAGWGVHMISSAAPRGVNGNIVRNNRIHDNARVGRRGAGIIVSSGRGTLVANNLIWRNAVGIQVDYHGVSGTKVYHNTIYGHRGAGIDIGPSSRDTQVWHNIIYGNGGAPIQRDTQSVHLEENFTSNPLFVDPGGGDFHLQPGSPAINKGFMLAEVPCDFEGRSRRGGPVDLGAYESNAPMASDCPKGAGGGSEPPKLPPPWNFRVEQR
jgi:hypothetical protein